MAPFSSAKIPAVTICVSVLSLQLCSPRQQMLPESAVDANGSHKSSEGWPVKAVGRGANRQDLRQLMIQSAADGSFN